MKESFGALSDQQHLVFVMETKEKLNENMKEKFAF